MFYCPLKHNAPLLFDIELFIYFPVLPVSPYERLGASCLLRHDLGGYKYIASICFPPLSGSDDTADKYSSSKAEEPRQQNKYVLCSIILIASSRLVGVAGGNRRLLLSDSDCFVFTQYGFCTWDLWLCTNAQTLILCMMILLAFKINSTFIHSHVSKATCTVAQFSINSAVCASACIQLQRNMCCSHKVILLVK